MSPKVVAVCFQGLARLSRRVWRRFVPGSRDISLVPSLLRASTDTLIIVYTLMDAEGWKRHGLWSRRRVNLALSRKMTNIRNFFNTW